MLLICELKWLLLFFPPQLMYKPDVGDADPTQETKNIFTTVFNLQASVTSEKPLQG